MSNDEICFMTASELAQRIRNKELSAREVIEAHLAQIERVNPKVNAIVTLLMTEQVWPSDSMRRSGLMEDNRWRNL